MWIAIVSGWALLSLAVVWLFAAMRRSDRERAAACLEHAKRWEREEWQARSRIALTSCPEDFAREAKCIENAEKEARFWRARAEAWDSGNI